MKSVVDGGNARKADLAAIHIGKAALGWDDAFYRSIMKAKCGVESAALLDHAGRKRLLDHMRACGWSGSTNVHQRAGKPASGRSRKPLTASQRLMWSLWQQLAAAKKVEDRGMPALLAFIRRQTNVDVHSAEQLSWLTFPQENLVIQSLKAWKKRDGTV